MDTFAKELKDKFRIRTQSLVAQRDNAVRVLSACEASLEIEENREAGIRHALEHATHEGDEFHVKKAQQELEVLEQSRKKVAELRAKLADLDDKIIAVGTDLVKEHATAFADQAHKELLAACDFIEAAHKAVREFQPGNPYSDSQLKRIFSLSSIDRKTKYLRLRVEKWL